MRPNSRGGLAATFVLLVGLCSVGSGRAAADTSDLPFDPLAIGNMSDDQRRQALATLGAGGSASLAINAAAGSAAQKGSASFSLPDVSQLTAEQRQQLLEQLQRANNVSSQINLIAAARNDEDQACQELLSRQEAARWQGDDRSFQGQAESLVSTPADRRSNGRASSGSGAPVSAVEAWERRDRCRTLAHQQSKELDESAPLKPFGYDLFIDAPSTFAPATDIPVPADYVLGPSDVIRVQLFGSENRTLVLPVNRDGTINMPKLGPISVVGQRFEDIRAQIEDRVEREVIGTSASVSLGDLRSVRVFILGDVAHPGSYTISSLATISNALLYAGGVSNSGSLRKIQLKRDGQLIRTLDLYDLLLHGDSNQDARILAGDVIFVPPVGRRIWMDGEVKRPAIYEIKDEQTLAQAVNLAGGVLASSLTGAAQVQRVDPRRGRYVEVVDLSQASGGQFVIEDGDQVKVRRVNGALENSVAVVGAVTYPGTYQWSDGMTLADVLKLSVVQPSDSFRQVYLPLGLIERTNTSSGTRDILSFNLQAALSSHAKPISLNRHDRVIILTRADIQYLDSQQVRDEVAGKSSQSPTAQQAGGSYSNPSGSAFDNSASATQLTVSSRLAPKCHGLDALGKLVNSQRALRYTSAFTQENPRTGKSSKSFIESEQCPVVFDQIPDALPFLLEESVSVYGEVKDPGLYPIAENTSVTSLLDAAGGLTRESDRRSIEYVSYAKAQHQENPEYEQIDLTSAAGAQQVIGPGDVLNVRPLYVGQEAGAVRLLGELRFPGTYGILRNERLSEVIRRAGGLTTVAYPYGAVFTREGARLAEYDANQRAARDLQDAIATAISSGAIGKDTQSSAELVGQIVKRLETAEPIGRVVIESDPTVLQLHPEQDPILEAGDTLFVPKRPVSVTVIGQVLNPGSIQFAPGQSAREYIDRAGGYAQAADESRTFVILPNGTAKTLKTSFWNFRPEEIPPGSVVVVPRDAAPFNLMVYSERIFSILGNLALTSAALVTVTKK